MRIIIILSMFCIVCSISALSQDKVDKFATSIPVSETTSPDRLAKYIRDNLNGEEEYLRATYVWIAKNITYDYVNQESYIAPKSIDILVKNTLATRLGVCQGFAELFRDLCRSNGVKAYVVAGYTRQNGQVVEVGHAWIAVKYLNGSWALFDPTWGAGHVQNDRYVKKYSDDFYKILPEDFIKSHIPFDPLWQLLNYPITHKDFYLNNYAPQKTRYFSYSDSIAVYERQDELQQDLGISRRVRACGIPNSATAKFLSTIEHNIEVLRYNVKVGEHNQMADRFNAASNKFNKIVIMFNNYIEYKNKQYKPEKPGKEILRSLDTINTQLLSVIDIIYTIKPSDQNFQSNLKDFFNSVMEVKNRTDEEIRFIKKKYKLGGK